MVGVVTITSFTLSYEQALRSQHQMKTLATFAAQSMIIVKYNLDMANSFVVFISVFD